MLCVQVLFEEVRLGGRKGGERVCSECTLPFPLERVVGEEEEEILCLKGFFF